jgi:hypothetical protein
MAGMPHTGAAKDVERSVADHDRARGADRAERGADGSSPCPRGGRRGRAPRGGGGWVAANASWATSSIQAGPCSRQSIHTRRPLERSTVSSAPATVRRMPAASPRDCAPGPVGLTTAYQSGIAAPTNSNLYAEMDFVLARASRGCQPTVALDVGPEAVEGTIRGRR